MKTDVLITVGTNCTENRIYIFIIRGKEALCKIAEQSYLHCEAQMSQSCNGPYPAWAGSGSVSLRKGSEGLKKRQTRE